MIELGELRTKLDQATERIVSRLKDRSRFPLNERVYHPDGVPIAGRSGISLLQFAIEGLEAYQASLGRYDYPDQYPVLGLNLPSTQVDRIIPPSPIAKLSIDVGRDLLTFYQGLLTKYCLSPDDPTTYGETVYVDADLLQLMHERINTGRYVAEAKAESDPALYEAREDRNILIAKLKDPVREEALLATAAEISTRYGLTPGFAEEAFRWMMDKTLEIEVAYIQQVGADRLRQFIK